MFRQFTLGLRSLDIRPGNFLLAYQRGPAVYWASTDDRLLAEEFVAAMP